MHGNREACLFSFEVLRHHYRIQHSRDRVCCYEEMKGGKRMFRTRMASESLNFVLKETRTSKFFNVCLLAELKNVLREITVRPKIKSSIELNG